MSVAFGARRRIQPTSDTLDQALPACDGKIAAMDADAGEVAAAANAAVPHQPDQLYELGLGARRLRSQSRMRSSAMLRWALVSGRGRV